LQQRGLAYTQSGDSHSSVSVWNSHIQSLVLNTAPGQPHKQGVVAAPDPLGPIRARISPGRMVPLHTKPEEQPVSQCLAGMEGRVVRGAAH
jgi:hypothetical protein